ncbi:ArnT family glycosyltransferase [Dictyobacter formicarum]|nr:glycosyltransferase family 39 protein [Dictyobacter formicarum]
MKIMRWRLDHFAIGVFVLALLVRVVYNLTVALHYYPLHDSQQYRDIGLHLVQAQCFCLHGNIPTVYRAPFWPLLIGLLSFLFGPNDLFVRLFLCVLDAATCLLIYLWVRDFLSARLALLAGIIAALYPGLYIYTGWLYSETLYTFLLTALCYVLYRLQRNRSVGLILLSGALLGLLALTRPNGLLMAGLFVVWILILGRQQVLNWRSAWRLAIVVPSIALLLIAPWTLRNYLVSQRFLPVATGDGTVLLGSYNDQVARKPWDQMTWSNPLRSVPEVSSAFPLYTCDARCEMRREDLYKEKSLQWMQAHMDEMPALLAAHAINMWIPAAHEADLPTDRFPDQLSSRIVLVLMNAFPLPIFLLAAWGLVVSWRRWRDLLLVYLIVLVTIGQDVALYGIPRFRAPIEPLLLLLAMCAISSGSKYLARRRPAEAATSG